MFAFSRILWTTWYESQAVLGWWPSLVFFNGWMCLLLVLHVYWFSLIVRVAYSALTQKEEVRGITLACNEFITVEINILT